MKMNFLVPVICAVLLGYLCASFIFNQYGIGEFAFGEKENVYFLQYGAYQTKEASDQKVEGISQSITVQEDNKYYAYIGMTMDLNIAKRIQKLYQENGIEIYIKESYIDNEDFLNQLTQYDVLLDSTKTADEVNSVLKTILATYDEFVLNP